MPENNTPSEELAHLLRELRGIVNNFSITGDGVSGNIHHGFIISDFDGQESESQI
jgi:hypothetical protein